MNSRHADLLVYGATVLTPNGAERIDIACMDNSISRFYRRIAVGAEWQPDHTLRLTETDQCFDPKEVYGDAPNPTKL